MPSLISTLSKNEQRELLEDLNYLNIGEIKTFCRRHSISYTIWIEMEGGSRKKTQDDDRKGIILDRIRRYLQTGKISGPTCFSASVICFNDPPENLKATDRLFYGQYDKKSARIIGLLEGLTAGKFKNGAIARILAREYWTKGIAPTYQEFAAAWVEMNEAHDRPNPEWAFLSDRANHKDTSNWKDLREKRAKRALSMLNRLSSLLLRQR